MSYLAATEYSQPLSEPSQKRMPLLVAVMLALQIAWVANRFLPFNIMSGGGGFEEATYGIHLALLDMLVFCMFLPFIKELPRDGVLIVALIAVIFSGILTQTIFANPQTYVQYFVSFAFTATYATQDANRPKNSQFKIGTLLPVFLLLCFVTGLLLVKYAAGWGELPFEFSRKSRGQVIFWRIMDLHYVLPCVAVLMMYVRHPLRHIMMIAAVITLIVIMSTYTRSWTMQCLLPFVLYALYRMKKVEARIAVSILGSIVIFSLYSDAILNWLSLARPGHDVNIKASLTGRLQLWQIYFDLFMTNPLVGYGYYNLVAQGILSSMGATTEVGILSWFTYFGIIFGLPMLWIVIWATVQGVKIIFLSEGNANALDLFCAIAFLSNLPNMALQEGARILHVADFLCYGAMFYLYYLSRERQSESEYPNAMVSEPRLAA